MNATSNGSDAEITYGIDKAAPNGDNTALTIIIGTVVYTFVGDDADAILAWHQQSLDAAVAEAQTGYELVGAPHRTIISEDMVIVRGSVIQFGQHKPPYDYLHILFDRDNKRIAFAKGDELDGISYKVNRNPHSGSYTIRARAFEGTLPNGIYKRNKVGYELSTSSKSQLKKQGKE